MGQIAAFCSFSLSPALPLLRPYWGEETGGCWIVTIAFLSTEIYISVLEPLMTVTFLFTVIEGNISFHSPSPWSDIKPYLGNIS